MQIQDRVIVVTGAGRGIGRAMCERFAKDGARAVVVADVDSQSAQDVAEAIGRVAVPLTCNVAIESDVQTLVEKVWSDFGHIDLYCANAGITVRGGIETSNADWQRMWDVNVMSRVYAARHLVPRMLERGSGYILQTASAAALVTEIGSASYTVTKHADLAFAEWLAVQYGRSGIGVSCMCPLGVETDMLDHDDPVHQFLQVQSISAEDCADAVVRGLEAESSLILPHPQVAEFFQMKADDHDRWVRGMQRLNQKLQRKAARRKIA